MSSSNVVLPKTINKVGAASTTNGIAAPPPERSSEVLARLLLDTVLTPRLRRMLTEPSRLVLIKVQDEDTANLLDRHLSGRDHPVAVEAYTEPHKSGGRNEPRGRSELNRLELGQSVILISQDLERILVPEAMAAADAIVVVPPPSLSVIRRTIRAVTGSVARGLRWSDLEGLGVFDFTIAIRPGLTSRDCVINLRRASLIRTARPASENAVPLEKLALTEVVSEWAFGTLGIMRRVGDGKLETSALRFACLEGPPGTGKTTVAAALAHSAGWTFIATTVAGWFASSGGHLGDVIRAARRFFDEIADAKGPIVGFLDEIDALPNRSTMDPEDATWWTPVITYVLTEIDRLRKSGKPVLLLAATNHVNRLDPALVRPGRLENQVSVLPPNEIERRALFASCLGSAISDEGLSVLARLSVKATPARIESWCRSAQAAAETDNRPLELRDLVDLLAPPSGRSAEKDRAVAIHEAGHAVVAHELGLPVSEISILAMEGAAGWVSTGLGDRLLTRPDVEHIGTMILAGRAADTILGDGANAGAGSDIKAVNALLRTAMLELGLYGPLATADHADLHNWHQGISLWSAINTELARLYEEAAQIVERRRDIIRQLAELLVAERVVTGTQLIEMVGRHTPMLPSEDSSQLMGRA